MGIHQAADVNIMIDKQDAQEYARGARAKQKLFEFVIKLGGTISGEHGIGTTKSEFIPLELDKTSLSIMKRLKTLFDPNNILNPGKIFPDS